MEGRVAAGAPGTGPVLAFEGTLDGAMANVLYCGDNLEILRAYRDHIPSDSVDLIYLDPPFNSQRTYNLIYKGSRAQEVAFKDYWSWEDAASTYATSMTGAVLPLRVRTILKSLHDVLVEDDSDLLAYLVMMTVRLVELHRVLKSTGSMYLHCDPTASHYLKVILDGLFGSDRFMNEITWKRTNARSATDRWPRLHDVLLVYAKGERTTFNPLKVLGDEAKMPHTLITGPDGKKYQTYELTAPNLRFGETGKEWKGFQPATMGRCWSNPPAVMDEWDRQGLVHWPTKVGAWPRRRAAEPFDPNSRVVAVGDVWTDIDRLNQTAKERMGYPTQKPIALLERIISASSNPGDLVLDPFCGCGTTIEACERLGRRWIGIDVSQKAVEVVERRFSVADRPPPEIMWCPPDVEAATALAEREPKQFEQWALRKIGARRMRKTDRGIDGEAFYQDGEDTDYHVLVSVKGGRTLNPSMVRDLSWTLTRERASIGVLLTMHPPTDGMKREATHAGFLPVADVHGPIPRIQILTVTDLFGGARVRAPGKSSTKAQSVAPPPGPVQQDLPIAIGQDAGQPKPGPAKARRSYPAVRQRRAR